MKTPASLANGRYVMQTLLGEGGMASVFVVEDQVLGVHRAIKMLAPHLCANARVRDRFIDEARAMARMKHPNIVTVHDVAIEEDDRPYIIMELVQGGSVGDLLKANGPQDPGVAGTIMTAVLDGLLCAHNEGIVHRDIKPDNVLLSRRGKPKITDFGIAQVRNTDHAGTRTGAVLGTLGYMAPEQRRDSKNVTLTADIYAAGTMLYTILKGTEPFDLYVQERQATAMAGIPSPLAAVIIKACSYSPADRYQSTTEMKQSILDALSQLQIEINPDGLVAIPDGVLGSTTRFRVPESDFDHLQKPATNETSAFSYISSNNEPVHATRPQQTKKPYFALLAIFLAAGAMGVWFGADKDPETPAAQCGDGVVNGTEACDDGNQLATDTCTNQCKLNVVFFHGGSPTDKMWKLGSSEPFNKRENAAAELPASPIFLHPFWIDRHEVTREAFTSWAKSDHSEAIRVPRAWSTEQPDEANLPANHLSHDDARAYCKSLEGDTPNEAHWEYAARSGGKDIQYPWGDEEPTCELAILGRPECSFGRSHPVCSRPKGNTEQGLCDMAGNVWEWTRSVFPHAEEHDYPMYAGPPGEVTWFSVQEKHINNRFWEVGFYNPPNFESQRTDTIRGGGHWMTANFFNRTRARYFLKKGQTERNVGFRCIYPAEAFKISSSPKG
jgi:cysteine-rich repeat protein